MFPCTNLGIALLFWGLFGQNYAKVIVNIRIYNYKNLYNLRHDGKKCENLHWVGDHCDPMFKICVSSTNNCDLVSKNINFWTNTKTLYTVYTQNIQVTNFPKSISINVQVDDHDSFDVPDHIAVFSSAFQINYLNFYYTKIMTVKPSGLNVGLQASVMVKCAKNYGGPKCKKRLDKNECDNTCRHGECELNTKDTYYCKCQSGWSGEYCIKFQTNNCSLLNCKKECNITGTLRECICVKNDIDIEICSEEYFPNKVTSTEPPDFLKSTQSSRGYAQSTLSYIETKPTDRISEVNTNKASQIMNKSVFPQNSNTNLSSNSGSIKTQKLHDDNPLGKTFFTPSTIIIGCLLIFLCICMIGLFLVVQNWKRKTNSKLLHVSTIQRPLPPIFYGRNAPTEKSKSLNNGNSALLRNTNLEEETCTIPFGCRNSQLFLLNNCTMDNVDIYEEPIINNMESLTCETEACESDGSDVYEIPKKFKK